MGNIGIDKQVLILSWLKLSNKMLGVTILNMKQLISRITIVFFTVVFSTMAAAKNISDEAIKNQLSLLSMKYNLPGIVISYKISNLPIKTIYVGNSSVYPAKPMEETTLFPVGSITKSFTAALILKLVQDKKISLDETLGDVAHKYHGKLSTMILKYPALKDMTIRELLNHTSGVPQSINTDTFKQYFINNPYRYYSSPFLINLAMGHKVYFKPGTKGAWSYTNTDYILLGLVIEDVTEKTLDANFQSLFLSAGIDNLYFATDGKVPQAALSRLATGYIPITDMDLIDKAFINNQVVPIPGLANINAYQIRPIYNLFSPAASGLIASSPALVQWYYCLFEGNVLDAYQRNEMLKAVKNGKYNSAGYGLGVTVHSYPGLGLVISHDGLQPGYSSMLMYIVKYKLVLALVTNISTNRVSTYNVRDGSIIPGVVTNILPLLVDTK